MSLSSKKSIKGYNRGKQKRDSNEISYEAQSWYPWGFNFRPDYMDGDDRWDGDPPRLTMREALQGRLFEVLGKLQVKSAQELAHDWWWRFW